jgi:hypothetical protein
MSLTDEWNATRLVLEDHQRVGNQIHGGCSCGFEGKRVADYLDHLTDQIMGVENGEDGEL